jgi:hypothetical protein
MSDREGAKTVSSDDASKTNVEREREQNQCRAGTRAKPMLSGNASKANAKR